MENMVPQGLIYNLPLAAVFILLAGVLIFSTDMGYRIGKQFTSIEDEPAKSQFSLVQGSVFGLLALLLAFTFAMAAGRFDARKQLVVDEANAIGTSYLRTRLLAAEQGERARELTREYVQYRLDFFNAGRDNDALVQAVGNSERTQNQLWSLGVEAANAEPLNVGVGLFVAAMNDVIDMHEKRLAALGNRVPESIVLLLAIVAVLTMLGVGYGAALHGRKVRIPTYMAVVLVSAVVVVTLDLDRPRRGLIEVGQGSLLRLERSLAQDAESEANR